MILYLKDSKESTKNFLDLINTLSKVVRYKINIQKLPRPPWVFLLKVTTSLFKNSAEKEKTLYPTLWAVISRRTF
jgi:hypothetical protein